MAIALRPNYFNHVIVLDVHGVGCDILPASQRYDMTRNLYDPESYKTSRSVTASSSCLSTYIAVTISFSFHISLLSEVSVVGVRV